MYPLVIFMEVLKLRWRLPSPAPSCSSGKKKPHCTPSKTQIVQVPSDRWIKSGPLDYSVWSCASDRLKVRSCVLKHACTMDVISCEARDPVPAVFESWPSDLIIRSRNARLHRRSPSPAHTGSFRVCWTRIWAWAWLVSLLHAPPYFC
jgi:hypothetical protein